MPKSLYILVSAAHTFQYDHDMNLIEKIRDACVAECESQERADKEAKEKFGEISKAVLVTDELLKIPEVQKMVNRHTIWDRIKVSEPEK